MLLYSAFSPSFFVYRFAQSRQFFVFFGLAKKQCEQASHPPIANFDLQGLDIFLKEKFRIQAI